MVLIFILTVAVLLTLFGGTALMYSKHLSCKISQVDTNNPRCTAIKLKLDNSCDVVIVSVYMPCLNNTIQPTTT